MHRRVFDLAEMPLRELNQALHDLTPGSNETAWEVLNPKGSHAVAVGVDQPVTIDVRGSVGYYCGGMNDGGADHRAWLGRTRRRRKHDVGRDHRSKAMPASMPAPPAAAGCWSSRAMRRRAAASR